MFIAYVGRPGGGKSHDAACKIVENLKGGRVVATNIDGMNEPRCLEQLKVLTGLSDTDLSQRFIFLAKDQVTTFWLPRVQNPGTEMEFTGPPLVPPGSLVVLDEVHKWINSREWNSDQNKRFCEWGAEHRHDGYDVILITQDINKLDKQVRSLVEWTYYYRKINFFGSLVKKKYVKYSYDGDDHEGKPTAPPTTHSYRPEIFKVYRSYTRGNVQEKDVQKHVNVLKHPVFFALPVVLIYAIYSVAHSSLASGDLFNSKKRLAALDAKKAAAPPSPAPGPAPVEPVAVNQVKTASLPPVPPAPASRKPSLKAEVPGPKKMDKSRTAPVPVPEWITIKITGLVDTGRGLRLFSGLVELTKYRDFDELLMVAEVPNGTRGVVPVPSASPEDEG